MSGELDAKRAVEHAKYMRAYSKPGYSMGKPRMKDAISDIYALPVRGAYLDVSCGNGEMIKAALQMGFLPCHGTEVVPSLIDGATVVRAEVHALPFTDKSFDVVTMFDVIEHLIPGDDELACRELARVASKFVVLTANNKTSQKHIGEELHINRRPYQEWDSLLRKWFAPHKVQWIKGRRNYISEAWKVTL
jgi:SAM-dependent methyltransferase